MSRRPPPEVPGYRLARMLGAGAMGKVWLAQRESDQRPVAVKFLNPMLAARPEVLRRFGREARAQASIDHPGVLKIHDQRLEPPTPYLVLELVEGEDLEELLKRRGKLPLQEVRRLGAELGSALDALHAAGVVHRDLKPSNLMVRGNGRLVVMDLGLAHVQDATALTETGALIGTPRYLSPEIVLGKKASPASDQYQMAIILYELLTGAAAVPGSSFSEVAVAITGGTRRPLPEDLEPLPEGLLEILLKGMAVRPEDRFESCGALASALDPPPPAEAARAPTEIPAASMSHLPARGATPDPDPRPRPLPRTMLLLPLFLAVFVGAVLWPRSPGAPEDVRWEVIGDVLKVSCAGEAPDGLRLRLPDREAPPRRAEGRVSFLVRDLPAERSIEARLVWEGGTGPINEIRADPPAIGPGLLLREGRRVEVVASRPVTARWDGSDEDLHLPAGASLLPSPGGLGEETVTLTWTEAGLDFRRSWSGETVWRGLVTELREHGGDLDPQEFLRARGRRYDRSGESFVQERERWRQLVEWIPDAFDAETLSREDLHWLWRRWELWQRSLSQERALGEDPPGYQVAPGRPGWRGESREKQGWGHPEVPVEPIGAERDSSGRIGLVTPASRKIQHTRFTASALEAEFSWPALPAGEHVQLAADLRPLHHHTQLGIRCGDASRPSLELHLWLLHPSRQPDEKFRGWLGVIVPRRLAPPAGTPCRIRTLDLLQPVPLRTGLRGLRAGVAAPR